MAPAQENEHSAWLDFCRAIAIGLVLLSHGRVFLREALPWTEVLRFGGFVGVELFFVLSGYLIGSILIRLAGEPARSWLSRFYLRRWLRTLPNYYLFLALNILFVVWGIRPGNLDVVWRYASFSQNLTMAPPLFFQEAWSLAVEEIFYLIFPASYLIVARLSGASLRRAILLVAVGGILLSLMARMLIAASVVSWEDEIRKVVFLRLDTLLMGVLLAWLKLCQPGYLKQSMAKTGAALLLVCTIYFASHTDAELNGSIFAKTGFMSLTSLGCAGMVLLGLGLRLPVWVSWLSSYVARISYAAYLTNIPVAMMLVQVLPCCHNSLLDSLALWGAFMSLTVTSATLIYRNYERPINQWRDARFPG